MKNAELEGLKDKIEIKNMDARQLIFADNSFDIIFSLFCIHNIEKESGQETALVELVRVLKPGGTAMVGEYFPNGS